MKLPMPFSGPTTYPGHSGVDFGRRNGTPIYASGPGVVGLLSRTERGGYITWIDYDNGPGVAYAHQNRHYVSKGMRVDEGTWIGEVGYSGHVEPPGPAGSHLHIEIANEPGYANVWKYFDSTRVVGAGKPSGGGSSSPSPTKPAPQNQPEEDEMIALRIRDYDGNTHLCILGNGVFRHLIQQDNPERIKNIVTSDDQWTDTDLVELPRLLKTYGCRGPIWRCEKGVFTVLDSETGNVMQGGMWSAAISR